MQTEDTEFGRPSDEDSSPALGASVRSSSNQSMQADTECGSPSDEDSSHALGASVRSSSNQSMQADTEFGPPSDEDSSHALGASVRSSSNQSMQVDGQTEPPYLSSEPSGWPALSKTCSYVSKKTERWGDATHPQAPDVRPKENLSRGSYCAWGRHRQPQNPDHTKQVQRYEEYKQPNTPVEVPSKAADSAKLPWRNKARPQLMSVGHREAGHREANVACIWSERDNDHDKQSNTHRKLGECDLTSDVAVENPRSRHAFGRLHSNHGDSAVHSAATEAGERRTMKGLHHRERNIITPTHLAEYRTLLTKTPNDVVAAISFQRSSFEDYLQALKPCDDQGIEVGLEILEVALRAKNSTILHNVLHRVAKSGFILTALIPYLSQLALKSLVGEKNNYVSTAGKLIQAIQEKLPTESIELVTVFLATIKGLQRSKSLVKTDDFEDILGEILTTVEALHADSISYLSKVTKQVVADIEPPTDFRQMSIVPTIDDFTQGIEVFLRKNRTRGPYLDVDQYLDVQFRLLREDFMTYLRQGVLMLRHMNTDNYKPGDIENVHIYKRVHNTDIHCNNMGTLARISFDVSSLKHVNWDTSKRLLDGSLVVLSSDNFQSITTGIVTSIEGKRDCLKNGILYVLITDSRVLTMHRDDVYTMIEGAAYFEAYRHTLEGLQELNETNLPLQPYLLNQNADPFAPPDYLTPDTKYDFKPLLGTEHSPKTKKVLKKEEWPGAEELSLDESQHKALHAAVTRKFSLIQGPPGTGKTFIGLKIVRLLMHNFNIWAKKTKDSKPLLLVCYTNHALDQFLEGILQFEKIENVVRVGGRSKSSDEKVKQCLIQNKNSRLGGRYVYALREHEKIVNIAKSRLTNIDTRLTSLKVLYNVMLPPHKEYFQKTQDPDEKPIFHDEETQDEEIQDEEFQTHKWLQTSTNVNYKYQQSRNNSKQTRKSYHQCDVTDLKAGDHMSDEEEVSIHNPWALPLRKRWMLYRLWMKRFREVCTEQLKQLLDEHNRLAAQLAEAKRNASFATLRMVRIIAMTTSGAAKHRQVIRRIGPPIVIVEEAAEVFEAHIITSLSQDCQHLILIGDHQQLRPNPSVYQMARKYHLDVSLFERMVRNNMLCESLTYQHRMRPEIAKLLVPHIYKHLNNHESVHNYQDIPGLSGNLFFLSHSEQETAQYEGGSRSNAHECAYLRELCTYLIKQGIEREHITVLTTYRGQVFEMKQHFSDQRLTENIRVTAVDDYQGEENEVILLSLVRSNEDGSAGFIKVANRICVALSRAKRGLYIIGNMQLFEESSVVWRNIAKELRADGRIVTGMPLYCQVHTSTRFNARTTYDFRKAPDGGCTRPCQARLRCGHACRLKCHPTDRDHTVYQCIKACPKTCEAAGHSCPKLCHEDCGQCQVLVEKTIPSCSHLQMVPCHQCPDEFDCQMPCNETCIVGHPCPKLCHEDCDYCEVLVEKTIPSCSHLQMVPCHQCPDELDCQMPCNRTCIVGHPCPKLCREECDYCEVLVEKTIPSCSHLQMVPCHQCLYEFDCQMPCNQTCRAGHPCPKLCHEECNDCEMLVEKTIPACSHLQMVPCHQCPDELECQMPCNETCRAGHPCPKLCHEECDDCEVLVEKTIPSCSHLQMVPCHQCPNEFDCPMPCNKTCRAGHPCPKRCHEVCGDCLEVIQFQHPCGHYVDVVCGRPRPTRCEETCTKLLLCQHPCYSRCKDGCAPCREVCLKGCSHQCCTKPCGAACDECDRWCARKCSHSRCTKLCKEVCDREPCDKFCQRRMQQCHHRCPGFCGEPCVPNCPVCQPKVFDEIHRSLQWKSNKGGRYVLLKPCLHVVPATFMDHHVRCYARYTAHHLHSLKLLQCPLCGALIRYCPRYREMTKKSEMALNIVQSAIRSSCEHRRKFSEYFTDRCYDKLLVVYAYDADYVILFLGCSSLIHECKQILKLLMWKQVSDVLDEEQCRSDLYSYLQQLSESLQNVNTTSLKEITNKTNLLFLACRAAHLGTSADTGDKHEISVIAKSAIASTQRGTNGTRQRMLVNCCAELYRIIPSTRGDYMTEIRDYYCEMCETSGQQNWIICGMGHAFLMTQACSSTATCLVCSVHRDLGLIHETPDQREQSKHHSQASQQCSTNSHKSTMKHSNTKKTEREKRKNSHKISMYTKDIKTNSTVGEHREEQRKSVAITPQKSKCTSRISVKHSKRDLHGSDTGIEIPMEQKTHSLGGHIPMEERVSRQLKSECKTHIVSKRELRKPTDENNSQSSKGTQLTSQKNTRGFTRQANHNYRQGRRGNDDQELKQKGYTRGGAINPFTEEYSSKSTGQQHMITKSKDSKEAYGNGTFAKKAGNKTPTLHTRMRSKNAIETNISMPGNSISHERHRAHKPTASGVVCEGRKTESTKYEDLRKRMGQDPSNSVPKQSKSRPYHFQRRANVQQIKSRGRLDSNHKGDLDEQKENKD